MSKQDNSYNEVDSLFAGHWKGDIVGRSVSKQSTCLPHILLNSNSCELLLLSSIKK